jgi:hypothetical protein
VTAVLETIARDLGYFHDYATELYMNQDGVQMVRCIRSFLPISRFESASQALADVYGDILDICRRVRLVYVNKRGRPRCKSPTLNRDLRF